MGDVDRVRATFSLSFGNPHPRVVERQDKHDSRQPHHEEPHDVLELHDVIVEPEDSQILSDCTMPEDGHLDLSA